MGLDMAYVQNDTGPASNLPAVAGLLSLLR